MSYAITNYVVQELSIFGRDSRTGQAIDNVFYMRCEDESLDYGEPLPGFALSNAVLTSFNTQWRNVNTLVSTHYSWGTMVLKSIKGIDVQGTTNNRKRKWIYESVDFYFSESDLDAGSYDGEALPTFNAYSVRKLTQFPGRSGRGSCRLGPVPEDLNINGKLDGSTAADVTSNFGGLQTGVESGATGTGSQVKMLVASKKLAGPTVTVPVFNDSSLWAHRIVQFLCNENVGSQISRKPRLDAIIATGA